MINLQGVQPEVAEFIRLQAKFNAEDIAVVVKRANITPAPTAAVWSYNVPFEIQSAAGETLPYTGTIDATIGDTSSAGTAAVSTATPAVVLGVGSVTVSGDAAAWLNSETATLTLSYTTAYGNAKTDTWVVTFTTP